MSNEVSRLTNTASESKPFVVSADTARILRLIQKVDDVYNEASNLLAYLYDDKTAESIMTAKYNEKFFGIVDELKGELADKIYDTLCKLENLVEDEIEI